jgi:hypothetical protein
LAGSQHDLLKASSQKPPKRFKKLTYLMTGHRLSQPEG